MSGKISTTEAKAKELRPWAEKLITKAKNPDLSDRRYLSGLLDEKVVKRLLDEAKKFDSRAGGYTRIIKTGPRKSDGARMAIIELVKQ